MGIPQMVCRSVFWILWLGLAFCTSAQATLPIGQIEGRIQTEDGDGVAGAVVVATPMRPPSDGSLGRPIRTISAKDGTFTVKNVPAGFYWICGELSGTELLNPCLWSSSPTAVELTDESTQSGAVVTLIQGRFVHVRVKDTNRLLRATEKGKQSKGALLVSVLGPRGSVPFVSVIDDGQERLLRIAVPLDTPLGLRLAPSRLRMADKAGKALAGRDMERQFTVKQEDAAPVFEFAVEDEAE